MRRSWTRWCAVAAPSAPLPPTADGAAASRPPPSASVQEASQEPTRSTASSANHSAAEATNKNSATDEAVPKSRRKFHIDSGYKGGTNYDERGAFFSSFASIGLFSLGCSFLFVPFYRIFCAPTGHGADPKFYTPEGQKEREERNRETPLPKKLIKMRFLSDVGNTMPIAFVPLQREVEMLVGEPALAFYGAYNRSNRTVLGVSSYTISPPEATNYLNKIQCFCFEEQRFKPHELIEMPVFFFLDRDFLLDPVVNWLDELILHYTFFNLERTREAIMRA